MSDGLKNFGRLELIYLNWQGATSKFQLRDYEIEMLDSIRNDLTESSKNNEALKVIKEELNPTFFIDDYGVPTMAVGCVHCPLSKEKYDLLRSCFND